MVSYNNKMKFYTDGDPYQDLYVLFARSRYLIFRAREKELQRYNLSPEQVQILFLTEALGKKATPAEISRLLIRKPHTISAILERMAKRGLVKKVKDLEHKNQVRAVLTEKGKEAYALSTKRGPVHRILGVLNERERKQFGQYLERIMAKAREELGMDRDELPASEYDAALD